MALRLNKREKYAILAMVVCLMGFVVLQFGIFPLMEEKERLGRTIQVKTEDLADLEALKGEYEAIAERAASARMRYGERESGFTLFSFLDRLAGQAGIKEQITFMKPSTVTQKDGKQKTFVVEMKIQEVSLNRLVPYLYMVETSPNMVYIRRLSISKPDKPEGVINAVLQVEASDV